jgi:hypothetical protein
MTDVIFLGDGPVCAKRQQGGGDAVDAATGSSGCVKIG